MRTRVTALVLSVLLVTGLVPSAARADVVTERSVAVASFDGTGIEVHVQHPPRSDPDHAYPVVFHGHGWGGSAPRGGLQRRYAEAGYLTVGWSVRGFGSSGGRVGVNGPNEAQDIVALIDWVLSEYEVSNHDGAPGKYDIGVVGDSYGGGSAYLAARFDERVKAIAPGMPWSRLDHSLHPGGRRSWAGTSCSSVPACQPPASATPRCSTAGSSPSPPPWGSTRPSRS
jgi:ABC-2 type transport system ATP-binding protein